MRETYRLTAPVILWWAWLVFVAANVVDWAIQGTTTRLAMTVGAIMLAVTGLVYALGLRPKVVADDGGITVLNPFRDHRVPWTAISDVDTADWVLVRAAGDKTIYCWALYMSSGARRRASAPPKKSTARISPRLPDEAQYLASLPPAKAIAARLDTRAKKARARHDSTAAGAVTVRWAWFPLAAVVAPAVAMLIVLLAD